MVSAIETAGTKTDCSSQITTKPMTHIRSTGDGSHSEIRQPKSRRAFLAENAMGLGSVALATLLHQDRLLATPKNIVTNPLHFDLAKKQPHKDAQAQAMISLFQHGGPAHMDLTDPKPQLTRFHGTEFKDDVQFSFINRATKTLMGTQWRFRPHGECGTELSELLPHTAEIVDDIALVSAPPSRPLQ